MKANVLVIDDNESVRKLIYSALSKDHQVKLAHDAEEAIGVLESFFPDLILLDVMLPGMSGPEMCAYLKNQERFKEIPIIMISARTGAASRSMGYNLGVNNYLEKPFDIGELKALVNLNLKRQQKKSMAPLHFGRLQVDWEGQRILLEKTPLPLTLSEYRLLLKMMKASQKIYSRQELLEAISSDSEDLGERAVDNHVSSIRKKIKDSQVAIKTIYGVGYQLVLEKNRD